MSEVLNFKCDANAIKQNLEEAEKRKKEFSKTKYFKLENGKQVYHVLGSLNDSNFYKLGQHFIKDPLGKTHVYKCAEEKQGFCLMCENVKKLKDNPQTKKLATDMRRQNKVFYNAINYKTGEFGILQVPITVHDALQLAFANDLAYGKNPFNTQDGFLAEINRIKGNDGPYDVSYTVINAGPRYTVPMEILQNYDNWPKLDQLYDDYTNEEFNAVLNGNFDPKGKKQAEANNDNDVGEQVKDREAPDADAPNFKTGSLPSFTLPAGVGSAEVTVAPGVVAASPAPMSLADALKTLGR